MNSPGSKPVYDALGNPIVVGSRIVYATTWGNSVQMCRGVVVGIKFKDIGYMNKDAPRIKVVSEERDWQGGWRARDRAVTIGNTHNIVVVADDAWEVDEERLWGYATSAKA